MNLIWTEARDKKVAPVPSASMAALPWRCAEDMKHFMELTVSIR